MALRKIVTLGDEALRKECKKVDKFNLRLHLLLKEQTLHLPPRLRGHRSTTTKPTKSSRC